MKTEMLFTVICLLAMVCDIATGLLQAIKNKTFTSAKMRVGLWHKVSFILIIALAFGLQYAETFVDLGYVVPLVVPVTLYIIGNEVSSILENIRLINPELEGSGLFDLFRKKKQDDEKKEE